MHGISKKSVALVLLAIVLVAGGWFWYASVRGKQLQTNRQQEEIIPTGSGAVPISVDFDVAHWQAKETDFFTIKFPKEWFWKELQDNTNVHVITNIGDFDISKYPELGINDGGLAITDDNEVVISFYGWPTLQGDEPEKSTEIIVRESFDGISQLMRKDYRSECVYKRSDQKPFILSCTDSDGMTYYYVADRQRTISMTIHRSKGSVIGNDIMDKISESMVLKK